MCTKSELSWTPEKMLFMLILTLAVHTSAAQGNSPCHPGWFLYQGVCYGFGDETVTWPEALALCRAYAGTLAEPREATVNDWIVSQLRNKGISFAWLGGTDIFHEGTWEWVSDKTTIGSFSNWHPGEPSNANGQDCLLLDGGWNYDWNDHHCDLKHGFVCEQRGESAMEPIVG